MKLICFYVAALSVICLVACHSKQTLFEKISSSHSGITFDNKIVENDSINPLDVVNIYNGGGVGIADFNNDGKQDIFFTGNMVPCKLYLNEGDFRFKDVTTEANVSGEGRWARGVSVIDINNDGLMDIYICNTIYKDSLRRRNILYVNQGVDASGIPHFKDMAAEYGLDVHVQSTMASFFDYDNDGDLDMYLTVNEASTGYNSSVFMHRHETTGSGPNRGRLFKNEWNALLKHPVFRDVSDSAGIVFSGYGHAATICDINNDGWKDIYVSDDFLSNNILYVNNHDGTFSNHVKDYFKHTSYNSMGQDVIDINNDGLPDVVELDMNAPDNYRKKMMSATSNYVTYQNFDNYGYQYQYVRNVLQLNQGPRPDSGNKKGAPVFSDISFMSGMSQTDWSWTPLVTDFDNDGYRDIVITNGFPKDVSDHDFATYRHDAANLLPKMEIIQQIPQVKLHSYAFHNNGDLTFKDVSLDWGLGRLNFSNGAAYVDLNNDGAMDMVVNNIDDEALVYKNTINEADTADHHYLQIQFKGGPQNVNGIGAVVSIYYDHGKMQVFDNNPYRGYLSSIQTGAHFGLGRVAQMDSIKVSWGPGKQQVLRNISANQTIKLDIKDVAATGEMLPAAPGPQALFKDLTSSFGIQYKDKDFDFIDFNVESVLPHKFSEYSPALASADVDGNGFDDLIVSGNSANPAKIFLQQANGSYIQHDVYPPSLFDHYKDEGILLFDANGDGKPDLYICSGGFRDEPDNKYYEDRLYINDGKGNFMKDSLALPVNHTSKLCVRAFDYNHDGELDLFVSGRVDPWHYPRPVSSFIYRNDSKDGHAKFTDVTKEVAPDLQNIGMVCDALFSDFDNDGQTDLILTGELMPVIFLKNQNGKFRNITSSTGISNQTGFWNSIVAGDFRHTGKMDYIVGNVGVNTLYKASGQYPMYVTAGDFNNNGGFEVIPSIFLPAEDGQPKEFPVNGRDEIIERAPALKKKFNNYKLFATATMDEIIPPDKRKNALRLKATMLQSCYLRNEGDGKFTMIPLPMQAQISALNGMLVEDFDHDGNEDVLINGNDFGTDISIGRYDALNGLMLKGDGKGQFKAQSIQQSGIFIPGNGKALISFLNADQQPVIAASQYRDELKFFAAGQNVKTVRVAADDISAVIHYKNGTITKKELNYGSSFLSQSARFILFDENIDYIVVTDSSGKTKRITP